MRFVHDEETERDERPASYGPGGDLARASILVADGDEQRRVQLRDELVAHGYEVVEAPDGGQALEMLAMAADGECSAPDAVVLDVCMPGYSGLGILSVTRRFAERPPTVLLSRLGDRSVDLLGMFLGADVVLHAPLDLEQVLAAVLHATMRRGGSRHRGWAAGH